MRSLLGPAHDPADEPAGDPADDPDAMGALARRRYGGPRIARAGRPWVLVNMVASLDGVIADAEGRSAGLSSPADKVVFRTLREVADVILVGAGTVRAENYGPVRLSDDAMQRRRAAGRPPLPRLAVVSGRAAIDPDGRLFDDPAQRPILVTGSTGAAAAGPLADRMDLVVAGGDRVDLGAALAQLPGPVVLCEGGPTLNGDLHAIDAIDELCLTVSPLVVGGDGLGLLAGPHRPTARGYQLAHVFEDDGILLLRYIRTG